MIDYTHIKHLLYPMRHHVRCVGHISPLIEEMAGVADMLSDELLPLLKGKLPEVDDYDNGDPPYFPDMNMENEGEPTFFLSKTKGMRGIWQYDRITRVEKLTAQWYLVNEFEDDTYRRKVCDAWHAANPRGRLNFIEWFTEDTAKERDAAAQLVKSVIRIGEMHSPKTTIVDVKPRTPTKKVCMLERLRKTKRLKNWDFTRQNPKRKKYE